MDTIAFATDSSSGSFPRKDSVTPAIPRVVLISDRSSSGLRVEAGSRSFRIPLSNGCMYSMDSSE